MVSLPSLDAEPTDVLSFLRANNVAEPILTSFCTHAVDGVSFCLLTEQDLREMGIVSIGPRKRLLFLSALWRRSIESCSTPRFCNLFSGSKNGCTPIAPNQSTDTNMATAMLYRKESQCHIQYGGSGEFLLAADPPRVVELRPHLWKVLVSAFYAFIVAGLTSFVMVLAHERLPDMSKYPPLPDLFLDNLPHISWAFEAAEWVGIVLMAIWATILVFHRYRCILLRRFFALMGTVFLLRSITMIITSLSVPGRHLTEHCAPYVFENRTARFQRAWDIWLGFGMSTRGIHTCGDYMFSGHTTCLTLLNFFITEYAPRKFQLLHTISWVLNLFGVFFILASHEHYSIDVFVAVYVSSRLFLYYHCLANNRILYQEDKDRAMIWFPMFSFLEYDVNGMVPNTYEIPFSAFFMAILSTRRAKSEHHAFNGKAVATDYSAPHEHAKCN